MLETKFLGAAFELSAHIKRTEKVVQLAILSETPICTQVVSDKVAKFKYILVSASEVNHKKELKSSHIVEVRSQ